MSKSEPNQEEHFEAGEILRRGWRQGSFAPAALCKAVFSTSFLSILGQMFTRVGRFLGADLIGGPCLPKLEDSHSLIVITHSCDLMNPSLEKEPYAELLLLRRVDKKNGQLTHGKNPRHIQIQAVTSTGTGLFESSIHDRFLVKRTLLTKHSPEREFALNEKTVHLLCRWLSSRYERVALPNTFNDRLSRVSKAIRRELREEGENLSGIWIKLDTEEELDPNSSYNLELLVGTIPSEVYETSEGREQAELALGRLSALINECEGIEVLNFEVLSEAHFTLDHQRDLIRLTDLEFLSFADDRANVLAPRT